MEQSLIDQLEKARLELKAAQGNVAEAEKALLDAAKSDIDKELSKRETPTGTINLGTVKITYPKTVVWDQDLLLEAYKSDGGDEYVKAKFSVSESEYAQWADNMKKYFEPARTVKAGKPRIEIVEEK